MMFLIRKESALYILSNNDMLDTGLGISLQGHYLHVGSRHNPLSLENYFFVHLWKAYTTPFALFLESELVVLT